MLKEIAKYELRDHSFLIRTGEVGEDGGGGGVRNERF